MTLELDPATEKQLKSAAARSGTSSRAFVIDALKERLTAAASKPLKRLPLTALMQQIGEGMSEREWARYAKLKSRRRQEKLTKGELAELVEMSCRLEKLSARRLELIAELARRRGTSLELEMTKLGIEPRRV